MRVAGWESRLSALIEAARHRPYELGVHDCFRMACAAVEALTGVDRWPEFEGRYHTERGALALLARHGSTFEDAGDWFFGVPRVDWANGRRGDIACLQDSTGRKHLGVICGSTIAALREDGMTFHPLSTARCVWRVG